MRGLLLPPSIQQKKVRAKGAGAIAKPRPVPAGTEPLVKIKNNIKMEMPRRFAKGDRKALGPCPQARTPLSK